MAQPLEEIIAGKYEILGKIAEGGIGAIYKVRHRLLDEIRVIKVLRPEQSERDEVQRRFLQEAKTAIRLRHPNIAQIYDFTVAETGTAYIVMEFIDGIGLDRVLSACGPPSLPLALELAHQTLRAIEYLHRHRFVHRDLSPDNLMLTRSFEDKPLIKIIDLGIVKNLSAKSQLTVAGMFLGKARYSSPEQFSSGDESSVVDHRSDIYSFGLVLYELLTGVCPIQGETFNELAAGHLFRPPVDFAKSDPDGRTPPGLRDLILRSLEKDPAARFASAADVAELLDEFRDPDSVSGDEFRETFVRAFASGAASATPDSPGTTQRKVDREFGIDRTTASGSESVGSIEPVLGHEPPPLAAASNQPRANALSELASPLPESGGEHYGPAEIPQPPIDRVPLSRPETVAPAAPEPAVEPPRPAGPASPSAPARNWWPILAVVALFFAALAAGLFWLRRPAPPRDFIVVEPAPVLDARPSPEETSEGDSTPTDEP
jgi:serine/threonine-protein kinase